MIAPCASVEFLVRLLDVVIFRFLLMEILPQCLRSAHPLTFSL